MKYLHYIPIFAALASVYLVFADHTPDPSLNEKTSYTSFCRKKLNEDLDIVVSDAKKVSENAQLCYKDHKNCKKSFLYSQEFEKSLISADLRVRWNHFSCHPLLFSKFRQLEQAAQEIQVFSQLKRKNEDIQRASKSILEPTLFIKTNIKQIEHYCCPTN